MAIHLTTEARHTERVAKSFPAEAVRTARSHRSGMLETTHLQLTLAFIPRVCQLNITVGYLLVGLDYAGGKRLVGALWES
jgi:hypothetical protein